MTKWIISGIAALAISLVIPAQAGAINE